MTDLAALKRDLEGLRVTDDPVLVKQKSQDFFWYSPVLKRQLEHVTGDIVVSPTSEAEVVQALKAAYAHGVPVTPRGAGTGNYGQAMPLSGGMVLNLARMNKVTAIHPGAVAAEAGAVLSQMDAQTRARVGQEMRLFPSTYRMATIGGFLAGGSGGVGSIRWGGLRNLGNVMRVRLVTMEAEPRILDLTGEDLLKALHAYGTNGIITEVEIPLTAAPDWVDVVVGFDDWMDAVRFCEEIGRADGLLVKEIAPVAAPVPHDYFLKHRKFIRRDQSVALLMVADFAMGGFEAFMKRSKGEVLFRADTATDEEKRGLPPLYELTWNHTTLRAIKIDPTITYLQVLYPFPDHLRLVEEMTKIFGDEVPGHLEVIRFDGNVTCSGLPIVRFTSEERLDEIIRIHEDHGCLIFNPHRYTLEEGGMKRTDAVQLEFKRKTDPRGLLNPGKMIGWDDPGYDLNSGRIYLFPGLQATG